MATDASPLTLTYAGRVLAPLTRDEGTRAIELALTSVARAGTRSRARLRIYEPELHIEKPERRGTPPRRWIRIRIADREAGCLHDLTVDDCGQVIRHRQRRDGFPGFSHEETAEAEGLVESQPEIQALRAAGELSVWHFSPGGPVDGHRRIGLCYLTTNSVGELTEQARVEVDLNTGEIGAVRIHELGGESDGCLR